MALVPITHVYDTLSVINNTGLLDGQILYTTDQTVNKIFADVKVNNILRRIEIGGTNTIDTVLDQESGHAIANSAVAKLAQTVHTNLLNPTLPTKTENGITLTNNGDGTFTLTGTATADTFFDQNDGSQPFTPPEGTYRYCGTPKNGSSTTYKSGLITDKGKNNDEFGNGINITFDGATTYTFRIVVYKNTTFPSGGLVFKPMLTTDLSASYDDFVAYSGDGELNANVADLYKNLNTTNSNLTALDTKVGAQSLLPTPSQSVTQNINTLKAEINQLNSDLSAITKYVNPNEMYTTTRVMSAGLNQLTDFTVFTSIVYGIADANDNSNILGMTLTNFALNVTVNSATTITIYYYPKQVL